MTKRIFKSLCIRLKERELIKGVSNAKYGHAILSLSAEKYFPTKHKPSPRRSNETEIFITFHNFSIEENLITFQLREHFTNPNKMYKVTIPFNHIKQIDY